MEFNLMEFKHTFRHQMGPSINNLVRAIHDDHLKKKIRPLAPLVQIL